MTALCAQQLLQQMTGIRATWPFSCAGGKTEARRGDMTRIFTVSAVSGCRLLSVPVWDFVFSPPCSPSRPLSHLPKSKLEKWAEPKMGFTHEAWSKPVHLWSWSPVFTLVGRWSMESWVDEWICWNYLTVQFIEHQPHGQVLRMVNAFCKFSLMLTTVLQMWLCDLWLTGEEIETQVKQLVQNHITGKRCNQGFIIQDGWSSTRWYDFSCIEQGLKWMR